MDNIGYNNSFEAVNDYFKDAMRTISHGLNNVVRSIFLDKGFSFDFCNELSCYISNEVSFYGSLTPSDIYIDYMWRNLNLTLKDVENLSKIEIVTMIERNEKIDNVIKKCFRKELAKN